ncbi:MAG: ChbG/HpnK family deacetylase [bacterium]|nr:ChbG/HpnK family deacetylase [bacterium]
MANPKSILITADDFGICDAIDNGIYECIDKTNSIDCVDVFVNYEGTESMKLNSSGNREAWDKSSEVRIKEFVNKYRSKIVAGDLKIGLHVSLNSGSSLSLGSENLDKIDRRIRRKVCREVVDGTNVWEFKCQGVPAIAHKLNNLLRISRRHGRNFLRDELEAQYKRFLEIMESAGLKGYKPFHISSHNGIYGGIQETYEMLREFCDKEGVEMRCPTLLNHTRDDDMKEWKREKTKMVSDVQFDLISALGTLGPIQGGLKISLWLKRVEKTFRSDKSEGKIISTEFFIEHFFLQGKRRNLLEIMDRVQSNKSPREQTYEMVVHPVQWSGTEDTDQIPRGVIHGKFEKRDIERATLSAVDTKRLRKTLKIGIYKNEWKPTLNS